MKESRSRWKSLPPARVLLVIASLGLNAVFWLCLRGRDRNVDILRCRVLVYAAGYRTGIEQELDLDLVASVQYLSTHWHLVRPSQHTDVLPGDTLVAASSMANLLFVTRDGMLLCLSEEEIHRLSEIMGELAGTYRFATENLGASRHPGGGLAVLKAALQESGGFDHLARYGDAPAW